MTLLFKIGQENFFSGEKVLIALNEKAKDYIQELHIVLFGADDKETYSFYFDGCYSHLFLKLPNDDNEKIEIRPCNEKMENTFFKKTFNQAIFNKIIEKERKKLKELNLSSKEKKERFKKLKDNAEKSAIEITPCDNLMIDLTNRLETVKKLMELGCLIKKV